jgi:hypothetical protein
MKTARMPETSYVDPYQADEAAAFVLMLQAGPVARDTTLDMFGIPADQAADLAARCAAHRGPRFATGADLLGEL